MSEQSFVNHMLPLFGHVKNNTAELLLIAPIPVKIKPVLLIKDKGAEIARLPYHR